MNTSNLISFWIWRLINIITVAELQQIWSRQRQANAQN